MKGFAKMTPERRREISRKGGIAAHIKGVAHKFTSEEAREAGKKGGKACNANRPKKAD
jgi:uncharacterized protein